jgi:hypothetical protein
MSLSARRQSYIISRFPVLLDLCILNILARLINLIADDNAIEDTIYHLHRALNVGRIDLERFLRVSVHCYLEINSF